MVEVSIALRVLVHALLHVVRKCVAEPASILTARPLLPAACVARSELQIKGFLCNVQSVLMWGGHRQKELVQLFLVWPYEPLAIV